MRFEDVDELELKLKGSTLRCAITSLARSLRKLKRTKAKSEAKHGKFIPEPGKMDVQLEAIKRQEAALDELEEKTGFKAALGRE